MWWKKRVEHPGAVFFQGSLSPTLESLSGLTRAGVDVRPVEPAPNQIWAAELRHPHWGTAQLSAPRDRLPLPADVIEFASGLSPSERQALQTGAQCPLFVQAEAQSEDVLLDRKRLLRFMDAVMAEDGVVAMDASAQLLWTSARLRDELQHDAPLDIIQVHVLHVVTEGSSVWLHSHGLGELGFVDFDVLQPAEELTGSQFDVLRAIAFAIVEGATSGPISPVIGAEPVALVDAETFMSSASPADRELRDPEDHTERRVVCCDPNPPGFFARMFGARQVRPSQLLRRGMDESRHLVSFSAEATELSATRARACLPLLQQLNDEFAEMECKALAKIGYPTDNGATGEREHLWFEVHSANTDSVDATLLSEPFDIAGMTAGQRAVHPVEQLTDWTLMSPGGQITPRSLETARLLRDARPEIMRALAEATADGERP